jgi:hypothetical protein
LLGTRTGLSRATGVVFCSSAGTCVWLSPETPSSRSRAGLDRYHAAAPTAWRVSVRRASRVRVSISARAPRRWR